jgi:hypothetical protein
MVTLAALWLPIVLSAVIVFVASAILHMVLSYHHSDYKKLPDEERVMEGLRKEGLFPGNYAFPYPKSQKDMGSPEMLEKYNEGPVGMMTVLPKGPPMMAKHLVLWFVFCLGISFTVAYLSGRMLEPGTHYLAVFRVTGTTAFMAYAASYVSDSIWKGQSWISTAKNVFDGLVYSLLTAGIFGWLWP